jgi:hypothetical protein
MAMPLPLMPSGADQVSTPMPGGPPGGGMAPSPTGAGPGGDLASLLGVGGGPPIGGAVDPLQMGLGQFDGLAQSIADLARAFPGSEQIASQMMELLDQWRQQVLVMNTPQASRMPGADMMM